MGGCGEVVQWIRWQNILSFQKATNIRGSAIMIFKPGEAG
jgi:hypothetical protein